MARQARTHPQTLQERLMPCAKVEALEAHCQVQCEQGIDSDESTVDDNDNNDHAEDAGDPQGEPALLETRICKNTVDMFKSVLLFSQGAAKALYNNQMITTQDILQGLTDDIIKELCHAIRKPGGDVTGDQISELSLTCLKLLAFWARHIWRTSRGVDNWTNTTWDDIKTLTNQSNLKDNLLDTKQPKTMAMTLDLQLAAKAFTDMLILLGKIWGIVGHPLSYVPRSNLKGPNDADIDNETKDPPSAFWPTREPSFLGTEQLRKLGRLQNYYLDQFNQNGVFIRQKQENAKQSCSRDRGEWALSFQVIVFPGNCSAHQGEAKHMH
jgi:hypothetical protein